MAGGFLMAGGTLKNHPFFGHVNFPLAIHLGVPPFCHTSEYSLSQWEFQDPKMEVLYHISGHILWGYSLKNSPYIYRPNIYGIGTSVLNRFLSHGH